MRVLLDTQAALLWTVRAEELPSRVTRLLDDAGTTVLISAATVWELAIKVQAGKLELPADYFDALLGTDLRFLDITEQHALAAGRLPLHHRDPFDRMLVAQAQAEGVSLVGGDAAFAAYDVDVFW